MCVCRGGGTGPAGPVLAGPLFSDQVINIHKLNLYPVVCSKRTAFAQPLRSRPDVVGLGILHCCSVLL